jgi:hypothetical protein
MGKSLIFKNANFASNSIPKINWYVKYKDANLIGEGIFLTSGFCIYSVELIRLGLIGKEINCIQVYARASGYITIGNYDNTEQTGSNVTTHYVKQGINTIILNQPLEITDTQTIFLEGEDILTYNKSCRYDPNKGWRFNAVGSPLNPNSRIPCNLGYLNQ